MKDYAVIKIAHRQYIVEPGKTYTVDRFPGEVGAKVSLDILAQGKGETLEVGTPLLKTKAQIEVMEQGKGEKVKTSVYKKKRYHRTKGIRKLTTTFKVVQIK
jgi:ribosomal protein L21